MVLSGIERQVSGGAIVPMGGRLPYYLETQTRQLLNLLMGLHQQQKNPKNIQRAEINKYLYSRTRPGFYLEIGEHIHIAYADQRSGHGTQHWWRIFFDDLYKQQIERFVQSSALTVTEQNASSGDDNNFRQDSVDNNVNSLKEWGGMYFRSVCEIKIAEQLDKQQVLFFANARGRIGRQDSPVSEASGWLTGRLEIDFVVFHKRKCMTLEVDGSHHQQSVQVTRDYVRDRVLLREGIATVRFEAKECFEKPADVVAEFLSMF